MKKRLAVVVAMALVLLLVLPGVAFASMIELASLANNGTQADGACYSPSINADGRYVAFTSSASNLVAGDANGFDDVFLRDLDTGTTTRVSAGSGGEANNNSGSPDIDGMGRYVIFDSAASNLVTGDTNNGFDIFRRDLVMGSTIRLSVSSSGVEANGPSYHPSISSDGRYVAFSSDAYNLVANDTNAQTDIFVRDVVGGTTTRVSVRSNGAQGNNESWGPSISADGRFVAFASYAGNLVSGDSNAFGDVFVHDMVTGATTRVSLSSGGV